MSDQPTPPLTALPPLATSLPAPSLAPPCIAATTSDSTSPVTPSPIPAEPSKPAAANALTADEQMALFAKDLQENDWGHQPC